MVDYNPSSAASGQVIPFLDLPSTATPVTAAWLNHLDDVLDAARAVHAVGNSGTSLTLDAGSTSGSVKTITLTGNCTITLSAVTTARLYTLELVLTQDGTGSRTITWPAAVKWSGGAPTLSTAAAAIDRILLTTYNGGTTWFGDLIGRGYA